MDFWEDSTVKCGAQFRLLIFNMFSNAEHLIVLYIEACYVPKKPLGRFVYGLCFLPDSIFSNQYILGTLYDQQYLVCFPSI